MSKLPLPRTFTGSEREILLSIRSYLTMLIPMIDKELNDISLGTLKISNGKIDYEAVLTELTPSLKSSDEIKLEFYKFIKKRLQNEGLIGTNTNDEE